MRRISRHRPSITDQHSTIRPRGLRLIFIGVIGFLFLTAAYTPLLILQQQRSLYEVSRYNASWLLSQGALEVARLAAIVAASAVPGSGVGRDQVQLWLDIVHNRVGLMESREVREFIWSSPELRAIVEEFRAAIVDAQSLVDTLDSPGHAQLLLAKLTDLIPKLARLASAAQTRNGELVALDLQQLNRLHWILSGVLLALIGCSLGLTVVVSWHNRMLHQAHQEVEDLSASLSSTSGELSVANLRVQRAMEAARNAHLLEAALEGAQLGSWVSDVTTGDRPDARLAWSQRTHRIFGLTEDEFDHKVATYWNLVHPEDRAAVTTAGRRAIESNEPYDIEHRVIRPDGAVRWVHQRASIQRDEFGTPLSILGVIQDTTDRRASAARLQELQVQLAHASRLTEISQMALGLTHELNQPLTATHNYLKALQRLIERADPQSLERAKEASQRAVSAVWRAGEFIHRLRAYVRKAAPERTVQHVATLIEEANALALIGARDSGVVVHIRASPDLPRVLVDKIQIQQVLINILRNAVEALESRPRREIVVEAACNDDGYVTVSVIDTGPGLAQDVATRLFQPFVTTKAHGMGVGLSLCRGIIEEHSGQLWAEQNPEGGAIFRFSVPAIDLDGAT